MSVEAKKNSVELSIKAGKNPSAMTLNEIRSELKSLGKQLNGLRPDLVKRLIESRIDNFDNNKKGKKTKGKKKKTASTFKMIFASDLTNFSQVN